MVAQLVPEREEPQEAREEIIEEEPEYTVNRRGRRIVTQKPDVPTPPPEQDASTDDPGAETIVEESGGGFFDMLRNMDPSTAAGFAALTSRRPRGQSAFSAFIEGKQWIIKEREAKNCKR